MKLFYHYFYLSSKNPELVDLLSTKWPRGATKIDGKNFNFSISVERNSQQQKEIEEVLKSLNFSTEPHGTQKGDFEKKDYERGKYFKGGPKKCADICAWAKLVGHTRIVINRPFPKFRYGICNEYSFINDQVRGAIESESFKDVIFLPVYLAKKKCKKSDDLENVKAELVPGVHALYSNLLLPHASSPDPLYDGIDKVPIRTSYVLKDFENLGFPYMVLAPYNYFISRTYSSDDDIDDEDATEWIFYSRKLCDFLSTKYKEFEWLPVILAEDA